MDKSILHEPTCPVCGENWIAVNDLERLGHLILHAIRASVKGVPS